MKNNLKSNKLQREKRYWILKLEKLKKKLKILDENTEMDETEKSKMLEEKRNFYKI